MGSVHAIKRMKVKQFDLKLGNLTPDAQLGSPGLDSLSVIEFMFNLEDALTIKHPEERGELKTVGDVAKVVDKLTAQQRASGRRSAAISGSKGSLGRFSASQPCGY